MREGFITKRFSPESRVLLGRVTEIVQAYVDQGYRMTLRQLYYRLVAANHIRNTPKSYNRLTWLLNDARLAGLVDWDAIEDRGRVLRGLTHWTSPAEIVESTVKNYNMDLWVGQHYRPTVFVEKDALLGVIQRPCTRWDTPFLSCRGYTSVTSLYDTYKRFQLAVDSGQVPVIIHLGDHDPSGVDMTRDILDRLNRFAELGEVRRIALTITQIKQYDPPPNPVKLTDSRHAKYVEEFGDDCWELDALDPKVLDDLISETLEALVDRDLWDERLKLQEQGRKKLRSVAKSLKPKPKPKSRKKRKPTAKKRKPTAKKRPPKTGTGRKK